jgi:TusA-related sulfurtransferase
VFTAVKTLKDMRQVANGNSIAVVADRKATTNVFTAELNA